MVTDLDLLPGDTDLDLDLARLCGERDRERECLRLGVRLRPLWRLAEGAGETLRSRQRDLPELAGDASFLDLLPPSSTESEGE